MGRDNEDGFAIVEMQYPAFPVAGECLSPSNIYKEMHYVLPNNAHFAVL